MTKTEIVAALGRDRVVEQIVDNISHGYSAPEMSDLSQMVYLILLEYDEAKIVDLWVNHQIRFFIARIVLNQFRSQNSPFFREYRKFMAKAEDITERDFSDDR